MILFDDSSWEYNFVLLMTLIIVICGIYTFVKVYLQQRKNKKNNQTDNTDHNE